MIEGAMSAHVQDRAGSKGPSGSTGSTGSGSIAVSLTHRPPPHVRPFVESVVGYHYAGFGAGVHRGLPSRHLTVVLSLDDPLDMTLPKAPGTRVSLAAVAGGLHASPVSIHHDGTQYGVQLQLTPLGARALFGMPAAELAHQVVPLDAALGRVAAGLGDRLHAAPGWDARFAALDAVLGAVMRPVRPPRAEVARVLDRLQATAGAAGIGELAREVGWSRRHLAEQFRREYGLTPKLLARVLRFERARWMVARPDRPALADVAAVCGYADQAHMTHDWVAFAGASPLAWLAEEQLPFVQDDGADQPASLSA
jgi:AraC-like DNA-binding protein